MSIFKVFSNGSQILLLPNITLLEMRGQVDNWYICLCSILQIVTCIPPVPILLSKKRWGHVSALHLLGELCKIETQKKPEHKGGGRWTPTPSLLQYAKLVLATSKREQETIYSRSGKESIIINAADRGPEHYLCFFFLFLFSVGSYSFGICPV